MNETDAARLLRIARTLWPDMTIEPATITAWTWALGDLPTAAVETAMKTWIRTSAFAPKPSDLRKLIAEETAAGEPWEAAWDELMTTIRARGVYLMDERFRSYREGWCGWSSPEVEAAIRHVGYREVCLADTETLGVLRAQFRDAYRSAQQRRIRDVQTGAHESLAVLASRLDADVAAGIGEPRPIGELLQRPPDHPNSKEQPA
jgi:hypothetical protein